MSGSISGRKRASNKRARLFIGAMLAASTSAFCPSLRASCSAWRRVPSSSRLRCAVAAVVDATGADAPPRWAVRRSRGSRRGMMMMGKGSERKKALRRAQQGGGKAAGPTAVVVSPGGGKIGLEDIDKSPTTLKGYQRLMDHWQAIDAPRRLEETYGQALQEGFDDPALLVHAAKALLVLKRVRIAEDLLNESQLAYKPWLRENIPEAFGLAREACRSNSPFLAKHLMAAAEMDVDAFRGWRKFREIPAPVVDDLTGESSGNSTSTATTPTTPVPHPAAPVVPPPPSSEVVQAGSSAGIGGSVLLEAAKELGPGAVERVNASATLYPNLVTSFVRTGHRDEAARVLNDAASVRLPILIDTANRLLKVFQTRRDLELTFLALDAMFAGGCPPNAQSYELISNSAVRSVDFVTGAVSMDTLPKLQLPEAAFIGRSNVGKSSLINMIANRKSLAYTSKRPGKTQQFNYFLMNNSTDLLNSFYLVDLPGLGYAKVPQGQRDKWLGFFRSYIMQRKSLRVLFHLVDGRHGPVGSDHKVMRLMKDMTPEARYVVVLTKADKTGNFVPRQVVDDVISALKEAGVPRTPIVVTSAQSKLGRADMWRYLRLAALGQRTVGGGAAAKAGAKEGGKGRAEQAGGGAPGRDERR